jgi:hypothetical protein
MGGIEVISPAIVVESSEIFFSHVLKVVQAPADVAHVMTNVTCGLHFHISLHDKELSVKAVRRVARSVLWFERAMEVLVPEDCRIN